MWQVIGHKRAVGLFQSCLERGSFAHAYLFVGPAQVGKMTLARELARALNCPSEQPPCGTCSSCQRIAAGIHPDIREIRLTGHPDAGKAQTVIGVDEIRRLERWASLPPFEGKRQVTVIDGAEMLSEEAANCLLKTLEEPPTGMVFVLLTTNEQLVPATVVSRCQRIELTPMPVSEVEAALIEKWGVAADSARLLARLSHGRLGWAVAASDGDGLGDRNSQLDELVNVIDGDNETRFACAAQMASDYGKNREAVWGRLDLWLDWWRDLMLVRCGLANLVVNLDRMDVLRRMAEDFTLSQMRLAIESIQLAGEHLRLNANPRLTFEVLVLGLPERAGQGKSVKKADPALR